MQNTSLTVKILIGIIVLLFAAAGFLLWKVNSYSTENNKALMEVDALSRRSDSLEAFIRVHKLNIVEIASDEDSALIERIRIKKEYIYITRDYETVYSILDTLSFNSAKRFWADRFDKFSR